MPATIALERELRNLIRRSQSQGALLSALVHPDLDASIYPLLAYIEAHPGSQGSDLAAHFHVGRATISRQLQRLEDLGLIEREIDAADARRRAIELTADGRLRLAAAAEARVALLREVLADWTDTDIHTLAELLGRYSRDFNKWRLAADPSSDSD